MYDFDETAMLTLDEMVLAFRSTLTGLSKLSKIDPPLEAEIEVIVIQGFDSARRAATRSGNTDSEFEGLDKEAFLNFCLNTPEIMSWIEYFDDLDEYEQELSSPQPVPIPKPTHINRSLEAEGVMNPTQGGLTRLQWERKGPSKEYLPRQKWQNVIPFLTPARLPDQSKEIPPHNFNLEWAYGYNAHSSRQNLHYSATGAIVYATAAVCVVQDVRDHNQNYFIQHTDLVISLKLYHTAQGRTIVASGEAGRRPVVHIWEAESLSLLSTLKGFHRIGVSQLDFSPDRTKIATMGLDVFHSIAVYTWTTRQCLWTSRSTFELVHDLRFLSDDQFSSCGRNHVFFWKANLNVGYKRYRGLFGNAVKPETLNCVAMVGNTVVTGSESGMLHIWEGRNLVTSVKGHTGSILAFFVLDRGEEKGLVSACSGGKIQLWNSKIELGATFNGGAMGAIEPAIVSICWDLVATKILVGFKSCEIFEMDSNDGRNAHLSAVVSGHSNYRVSGVAVHPTNPNLFCTVGDDKSVRVFDAARRLQLRVSMLDTKCHCCSYSPDGQLLLVGLGSGVEGAEERKEGGYVILNEHDLTLVHEARDSKQMITDCKFSPDGSLMALSSLDGSVYVYNTADYAARARCKGHIGKVLHVDFSHNGQFLMTNDSVGELLFWDAEKGELQPPKSLKEMLWASNSCVNSYATQGCWGLYEDGTYCNKSCRSHAKDVVAAVDNYGRVRIFSAPCVKDDASFKQLNGHGADVQNCQFSCDDSRFYSIGGKDGSILQWRVSLPDVQDYEELKVDDSVTKLLPMEMRFNGKLLSKNRTHENAINDLPFAVCDMEEGVVDVSQLLPWQRTIVAPSRVPPEDTSEPPDVLELNFVYGFTTDRSRQSLKYSRAGEVLFFSAGVAVIMNQKSRLQKFYQNHTSTITSMAVHPTEHIVATGDQGEVPVIHLWDSQTMTTISILSGFHRRAVTHLQFSPNGNWLVSVGQDNFHSIAVYDWRNEHIVTHSLGFSQNSFDISFNPVGNGLVHCGDEIIRFWEINGLNISHFDALLGSRAKRQAFLCIGWIGNNVVIGTVDGNLYRFVGRQLDSMTQAHSGAVCAIASSNGGICTASSDRYVKLWSTSLECRLVIDVKNLSAVTLNVRCVSWDTEFHRILLGTSGSEIFEVSSGDGENLHEKSLLQGHSGDELWGLTVNPRKDEFCTVGDDSFLQVWDLYSHKVLASVPLELPARSCAFSPDGRRLAVGFGCPQKLSNRQYDGKWVVLDADDYQVIHEARDSTKWITDIKYSPSGELLAMGSFDNKIYIYNTLEGYSLVGEISKHQAYIRNIDFSEDGTWLQSNCAGFELMYFEADTGLYIPAASRLRDSNWATQSCCMGWPVQGIWTPQKDGREVTACECNLFRGGDGTIVVSGDNIGHIQMFRYPCISPFGCGKKYRASASPITRLRFAAGDSVLLSLSGQDKVIMQWAHKRDRSDEVAWNTLERGGVVDEDEDDVLAFLGLSNSDPGVIDTKELNVTLGGKPWVAAVVPPTNAKSADHCGPSLRFEKSHLLGNQSESTRSSVRFNNAGDILFPASKYTIVFNKKKNKQNYYEGHGAEISCLAVSRDGALAASAQKCNRPLIHIWDACTCESITELQLLHRRGVSSLQFSYNRKFLVSIGQDQDHSIALWQSPNGSWTDGCLLAWNKGDVNPSLFCSFYDKSTNPAFVLASGGRFHQKFWNVDGKCLNANFAEYDKKQKLGTLLCGTSVNHSFVSGSTSGHLYVWWGRKLNRVIRAHELGVSSIWSSDCGFITASKDGVIKNWTLEFEHVRSFNLRDADTPPLMTVIRSVDAALSLGRDAITRVLVGTASGEIYEIAARSGNVCLVHEAHYIGELWGLCVHPTDADVFATAGDDKSVRIWSVSHRRVLRKAVLDCTARCINWSPDGRNLIVGMGGSSDGKRQRKDGAFIVLDANNLRPVFEGRCVEK